MNRYSYALNNPYRYKDEDGHNPFAIIGGIIGAVKGAYDNLKSQLTAKNSCWGCVNYKQVGKAALTGEAAGIVAGFTFGLIAPASAPAAGSGIGAVLQYASGVGAASAGAKVTGSQASIAANNALSGNSITSGLGNPQQVASNAVSGFSEGFKAGGYGGIFAASAPNIGSNSISPASTSNLKIENGKAIVTYKNLLPRGTQGDYHESIYASTDRYDNIYRINIHGTIQSAGGSENSHPYSGDAFIEDDLASFLKSAK